MTMTTTAPIPCPFCGNPASPMIRPGCEGIHNLSVGCRTLFCPGDATHGRRYDEDELPEAVAAWNRRTMPEEVKRLVELTFEALAMDFIHRVASDHIEAACAAVRAYYGGMP